MITAAILSKTVIKKVIDSQIPKDKLILLCGNLINSASSINISLNIKKELANSIRSVMLHFELTGNEDKIYEGIFPYVKQILQEDTPEKIIIGLICLKDIFDVTDRKLYEMFIDTKIRVLQISSKYLLFVQGALIETTSNKNDVFNFQQDITHKNPEQIKNACTYGLEILLLSIQMFNELFEKLSDFSRKSLTKIGSDDDIAMFI